MRGTRHTTYTRTRPRLVERRRSEVESECDSAYLRIAHARLRRGRASFSRPSLDLASRLDFISSLARVCFARAALPSVSFRANLVSQRERNRGKSRSENRRRNSARRRIRAAGKLYRFHDLYLRYFSIVAFLGFGIVPNLTAFLAMLANVRNGLRN